MVSTRDAFANGRRQASAADLWGTQECGMIAEDDGPRTCCSWTLAISPLIFSPLRTPLRYQIVFAE